MANILWKLMARKYDQRFKTLYGPIIPLFTQSVISKDSVIELGCGSGLVSFPALPLVKKFVGVDNDPLMIAVANEKLQNLRDPSLNAKFIVADASKSNFVSSNAKYDKIFLVNILHVVDSPQAVLMQAMSLLKLNGSILIADFCHGEKKSFKYSLLSSLMNLSAKFGLMEKLWRFSFSDMEQLVLDMGFNIMQKKNSLKKFPFTFIECTLNAHNTES